MSSEIFKTPHSHNSERGRGKNEAQVAAGKALRWKSLLLGHSYNYDVCIFFFFLPFFPTHGLWSPDEASIFVSTDGVRLIRQDGILFEDLIVVIIWAVDQHHIHHFLFVQGGLEDPHDGLHVVANLEKKKMFCEIYR